MNLKLLASVVVLGAAAAACQSIPKEMTLAQYCADPAKAGRDVCKINVEIDGQKQALAQTNMSVSEARMVANDALNRANSAQAAADRANAAITEASERPLNCETRTLQRTKVCSCSPGYKLVSCTQTRFTYRAGAPSILRAVDDESCRFQDQVLEMQVRCCTAAQNATPLPAVSPAQPAQPATGGQSS